MKKNFKDHSNFKRNYYVVSLDGKYCEGIHPNDIPAIREAGMKYEFCIPYIEGTRKFDFFTTSCKIIVEEITTDKRYFDL